jgi:hypothetical protein
LKDAVRFVLALASVGCLTVAQTALARYLPQQSPTSASSETEIAGRFISLEPKGTTVTVAGQSPHPDSDLVQRGNCGDTNLARCALIHRARTHEHPTVEHPAPKGPRFARRQRSVGVVRQTPRMHSALDSGHRTVTVDQPISEHPSLEALVSEFVQQIRTRYPDRLALRPAALRKRIVRLLNAGLLPHRRPSGRHRLQRVNEAVEMYRQQRDAIRRGKLEQVNWNAIAIECIPGYAKMTAPRRRDELKRLRDAVHARSRRKRRNGEPPSARAT